MYGKGNNGCEALSIIRDLIKLGRKIVLIYASNRTCKKVKRELKILKELGVEPEIEIGKIVCGDIIIYGLLEYKG